MVRQLWNVPVNTRDGVRLAADVYLPAEGLDGGPHPGVLTRTPYGRQTAVYVEMARHLAEHGYVVVLQDVRGRGDSDGDWITFRGEGPDGFDTVEWMASQPWCNGRIGTFGGSYGGWCQWALAREHPPHLATMISTAAVGAWMQEVPWDNGCLFLPKVCWVAGMDGRTSQDPTLVDNWPSVFRHLPVATMGDALGRDLPLWQEYLSHPTFDDYWRSMRLDEDLADVDVPALHVTGWYDNNQPGALFFYRGVDDASQRAADHHLVIGPWDHGGTQETPGQLFGGVDFGRDSVSDLFELHRRWFDRWLKDETSEWQQGRVRLFLTGENRWHETTAWPPSDVELRKLYLRSEGAANTLAGDGRLASESATSDEPADVYTYDPRDPVSCLLDENFFSPSFLETPLDHRFRHEHDDVLVYTAEPQGESFAVAGKPVVHLFAATDGLDTDWFADLHDVSAEGASQLLARGRLRGRFRETLEVEALLKPDEVYEFVFELSAVGHVVRPRHRLRLTVTSSCFPLWDRNPNTGAPLGQDAELRVAVNRIYHEANRESRVELPISSLLLRDERTRPTSDPN